MGGRKQGRRLLGVWLGIIVPISWIGLAWADKLSIGTWNMQGSTGFDSRASDIQEFGEFARNVDFLMLQEALSGTQVDDLLDLAGRSKWYRAVSDFSDDSRGKVYQRLEVAIASPHKITRVIEVDPYAGDDAKGAEGSHRDLEVPAYLPRDQRERMGARGWLWVEFAELNIVAIALHLKSSVGNVGKRDEKNSFKREAIAAALIESIRAHAQDHASWSYVVAGDFNVAPGDSGKVGPDLSLRCQDQRCGGYDQTHALFGSGHVDGFIMRNLVLGLGSSYAAEDFAQSPIDNVYVMGPRFDETIKVISERAKTFGSDHYAIRVTVWSE